MAKVKKPRNVENTVISFSGGRTSALMTIEVLKQPETADTVIIFANTGKEAEGTLLFVHQVDLYIQKEFGKSIHWLEYNPDPAIWFNVVTYETAARNGEPFEALIRKRKYLPNRMARFCTQDLKIRTMKKFVQQIIGWKNWTNLVGIRYDEPNRWSKSKSVERNEVFDVEHPLVKWKITKPDVLKYWENMPFNLDILEEDGNCDVCFLKGKKKKLSIARRNPAAFDWWVRMENQRSARWRSEYTYQQLLDMMKRSPELFDYDDSIECFCNID